MSGKAKAICYMIFSAGSFACMNAFVRLAGDVPSVEKSFFRNLVAALCSAGHLTAGEAGICHQERAAALPFSTIYFGHHRGSVQLLCSRPSAAPQRLHPQQDVSVFCAALFLYSLKGAADPIPNRGGVDRLYRGAVCGSSHRREYGAGTLSHRLDQRHRRPAGRTRWCGSWG